MRCRILAVLLLSLVILSAAPAWGQQTEKRSEVELLPVGAPKEELQPRAWGLYDAHWTMEIGWQHVNVHGNNDVYRSQLNYRDGPRIFNFSVNAKARDRGAFWTDMYLTAGGWGGDPYNWIRYGLSKEKWFEFKADYLKSEYFFVFPGFALDQHRNDQERRRQNYDLTLFPKRQVRVRLAYRRNSSFTGFNPVLTTFDFDRDEYTLFEPLRQTYDEYTVGVDWNIGKWSFFADYNYRYFRYDRFLELVTPPIPNPGNAVGPTTSNLSFLERDYPGRGKTPFVRFTVTGRPHRTFDVSARLIYSRNEFDYTRSEFLTGRTRNPGSNITQSFGSDGDILRPNTLADVSATWRPLTKLTLSNTFRFNGFDIAGFDQTNIFTTCNPVTSTCSPGPDGERPANLFDVDYYVNRFEIRYDFTRWLGVRAGHRYLRRDTVIHDTETACANSTLPDCTGGTLTFDETRDLATRVANVLLLGGDFKPNRRFGLFVDYERGGIDSVFNRVRRGRRTTLRLRARWEPMEGMRVNATWVRFDLRAPSPDVDSNQRNRGFTVDFAWTKWERFYFDTGYARNDVSSFTDIGRRTSATVFLLVDGPTGVNCTLVGGVWLRQVALGLPCRPSIYIDNNNYAYFDFGARLIGNLHAEAGYRVFFATGTYPPSDPDATCTNVFFGPCQAFPINPFTGLPERTEWGGMNFHQPHLMLRYVVNDNLSFKGGYRWYGYNLKQGTESDYKTHLITTSMMVSF
ncbi:MAG: hypothetical protein L0212_08280 [Acidobacteria bacterium]|nr:hypothetical protein [Acidobacteriota bacterium]